MTATVLVVDDVEANLKLLEARLTADYFEVRTARNGQEALDVCAQERTDVVLLDVMMPGMDGFEVCRRLKADGDLPFMPIILVTARADTRDVVTGLEAGADEYLTKPIDQSALVARVKSVLRLKELHDKVQEQAHELADWNRTLEQRVTEQVAEIERLGRLKSFLAPQIAEIVLSSGEELLDSHRRDVTVLFCDLRGFTAFAETAEPEEVIAVLREYHADLGGLIHEFEGTLHRFAGDGIMVLFNDPLPCVDPALRAVRLAVAMRDHAAALATNWRKLGHELGFGVGIAHGYATLGRIGCEGRFDYSANGSVVNLAARLCAEAKNGQILIDSKVFAAIEELAETEPVGGLVLKGFHRPIQAFNVNVCPVHP